MSREVVKVFVSKKVKRKQQRFEKSKTVKAPVKLGSTLVFYMVPLFFGMMCATSLPLAANCLSSSFHSASPDAVLSESLLPLFADKYEGAMETCLPAPFIEDAS